MSQQPDATAVVHISEEVMRKPLRVVDVERETGSGGASTDVARESSEASPRLIPVPDSPPISV